MKQLNGLQHVQALGPQASATTARTAALDTSTYGADYVKLIIPISAEANTNATGVTLAVLHSDDTVVTNHVSLGTALIDNAAAICAVVDVNLNGKKKNLRVTVTPDTTTNGAVLVGGIVAVIDPEQRGLTADTTSSVLVIT